jgi:NADH-quinone oxidoreductase subunit E
MYTLETVACFGSCAIGPVVVVDDKVSADMDSDKVVKVLQDLVKGDVHYVPE